MTALADEDDGPPGFVKLPVICIDPSNGQLGYLDVLFLPEHVAHVQSWGPPPAGGGAGSARIVTCHCKTYHLAMTREEAERLLLSGGWNPGLTP